MKKNQGADREDTGASATRVTGDGAGPAEADYFAGVRPPVCHNYWTVPDTARPRSQLASGAFPFFYEYFEENGMSFHVSNDKGDLVLYLTCDVDQCAPIFESPCAIRWKRLANSTLSVSLAIFDDADDPLITPFMFPFDDPEFGVQAAHDAIRLVEQECISLCILVRQDQALYFYDRRVLELSDETRSGLAPVIREMLRDVAFTLGD